MEIRFFNRFFMLHFIFMAVLVFYILGSLSEFIVSTKDYLLEIARNSKIPFVYLSLKSYRLCRPRRVTRN